MFCDPVFWCCHALFLPKRGHFSTDTHNHFSLTISQSIIDQLLLHHQLAPLGIVPNAADVMVYRYPYGAGPLYRSTDIQMTIAFQHEACSYIYLVLIQSSFS